MKKTDYKMENNESAETSTDTNSEICIDSLLKEFASNMAEKSHSFKNGFFNYYFDVHTNRIDDYAIYSKYGHCV